MLAMSITVQFGRNLRHQRTQRQLSQEELADMSGLHRTYISGLERGVRNPSIVIVGRLAVALGIEPCVLLEKEDTS